MIFAVGSSLGGTSLLVGVTLAELRAMLADPGRTVHGSAGGFDVIVFGAETNDEARAVVQRWNEARDN